MSGFAFMLRIGRVMITQHGLFLYRGHQSVGKAARADGAEKRLRVGSKVNRWLDWDRIL